MDCLKTNLGSYYFSLILNFVDVDFFLCVILCIFSIYTFDCSLLFLQTLPFYVLRVIRSSFMTHFLQFPRICANTNILMFFRMQSYIYQSTAEYENWTKIQHLACFSFAAISSVVLNNVHFIRDCCKLWL